MKAAIKKDSRFFLTYKILINMKNIIYIFILTCFSVFIINCSSPVYVQKDSTINLSNYKTYTWIETQANQKENIKRPAQYADVSVRNATNEELKKAGYREVSDNADLLVSYDVLIERTIAQRSDPVYSQSFSRFYYNPRFRRWGSIYFPPQFLGYQNYDVPIKEGTITISLIDANTDKIVWQAWTTKQLNYSRLTNDEITTSVKNIFSKLNTSK